MSAISTYFNIASIRRRRLFHFNISCSNDYWSGATSASAVITMTNMLLPNHVLSRPTSPAGRGADDDAADLDEDASWYT